MSSPLLRHARVLAFGILCGLTSGVGQTFFISLFVPDCESRFDLTKTQFSSVYSVCTILSAFLLPWVGARIDRIPVRRFFWQACALLVVGSVLCATAPALVFFVPGLFLLRFAGQGLCSHTWNTSVSRFFVQARGRALGIASLGHPLSEAVFPVAVTALTAAASVTTGWAAVGVFALLVSVPLSWWLLSPYDTSPGQFQQPSEEWQSTSTSTDNSTDDDVVTPVSWTRMDVFTDLRTWLMLPSWFAPGFFLTGLFFHQLVLAKEMTWTPKYLASCFVAFGISRAVGSFSGGFFTDALGARVMVIVQTLPLTLALSLFAVSNDAWVAVGYLSLSGFGIGLGSSARTTFLADRFGTLHLGAIRSLMMPIGVLATAIAPPIIGVLLDADVSFVTINSWSAALLAALTVMCALGVAAFGAAGAPRRLR